MEHERIADTKGNVFELRPIACPICGVRDTRFVGLRGGKHHRYGLGVESRIVACKRCSLLYPDPFPFPVDAQRLYGDPDKYFGAKSEEQKIAKYRGLVREAAAHAGVATPSILDVGSGRAELVQAARLEGCTDVVGLEFSDAMIEHARKSLGVELVPSTIEEYAAKTKRTFDVVVLNAVLEHVYDPDAMIAAVAALLRPGGVVYIDVPRDPNLVTEVAHVVGRLRRTRTVVNLAPTFPPYHVFGFTERSLGKLLAKHGLAIEELLVEVGVHVPHDGSLRDRARALAASAIFRVANRIGRAGNMFVWARKKS